MRRSRVPAALLTILLTMLLPGAVMAGKNAGGALIVHTQDSYVYSAVTACTTTYSTPASCEEANTRSDKSEGTVVWLLAAFPDSSSPAVSGIYFGIDYDDVNLDPGVSLQVCGPDGSQQIPDAGWPYEGRGNTVAFSSPIEGNHLFPFYVFKIDGGTDSSYFSTGINPTGGYAAFFDDSFPPVNDEITNFGTVRWYAAGENSCPATGDSPGGDSAESGEEDESQGQSEGDWAEEDSDGEVTFIEIDPAYAGSFTDACSDLASAYGIRLLSTMAPDGVICRAGRAQRAAIQADSRVRIVTHEPLLEQEEDPTPQPGPGDPGYAAHVWNRVLAYMQPDTTHADGFGPEYSCSYSDEREESADLLPLQQTSRYLLGRIGYSVIFIESAQEADSCSAPNYIEDWTPERVDNVLSAIQAGTLGLVNQVGNGFVRFAMDTVVTCVTDVEPIQLPHYNLTWVADAMLQLGCDTTSVDPGTSMWRLCNERRTAKHEDWHYLILVVNDYCDPDHRFADPPPQVYVSFSWYNGPCLVLLPLNGDGTGIPPTALDYVVEHETCHVFGAEDEYRSIPASCTWPYGYLRVPNTNNIACMGPGEEQAPCMMAGGIVRSLCDVTRGQVGWRDASQPRDGVYDPIDHPDSHMSVLIGEGDTLGFGDVVDVEDEFRHFRRRLAVTDWCMDQGRMTWDGIAFTGLPDSSGRYTWRKNGGPRHQVMLEPDESSPAITDLRIRYGLGGHGPDTVSFGFTDSEAHSGRVRLSLQELGRGGEVKLEEDKYYLDTELAGVPFTYTEELKPGLWDFVLKIWDGCGGHVVADSLVGLCGIEDRMLQEPEVMLSEGRPNPSAGRVAWDLKLRSASRIGLRLFTVDGRCVRSWPERIVPMGLSRLVWDGRTESGRKVAPGRYYLAVSSPDGRMRSGCVTIVR
jgi:hypothetical protein